MKLYYIIGDCTDPYINLAAEWRLMQTHKEGIALFLWSNDNTVVIGAHQNPYAEVDINLFLADSGRIARRKTGGGAVYHDLGNLNFSFVADRKYYDKAKQLSVIRLAVEELGIECGESGRNDIVCNGRKFSGNAYYETQKNCLHHGTLLIDTDLAKMKKYLNPSGEKLAKKGVKSVESRVINLSEILPDLKAEDMKEPLKKAFMKVYGGAAQELKAVADGETAELAREFADDKYIFGNWRDFAATAKKSFDWGIAEIKIVCGGGAVREIEIATDCLFPDEVIKAEKLLTGVRTVDLQKTEANEWALDGISGDIIDLARNALCTI